MSYMTFAALMACCVNHPLDGRYRIYQYVPGRWTSFCDPVVGKDEWPVRCRVPDSRT